MGRDHYETLGVKRDATADEIKRAYRRLLKKYHPDRNPNDPSAEHRFKEVQEAYDVLGNSEKRTLYDQYGDAAVGHWETDPRGQRVYTWGEGAQIPFDDLESLFGAMGGGASVFSDLFGGGRRTTTRRRARPTPVRGEDVVRRANLSFEQAVHGTTLEVDVADRGEGGRRQTLEVKVPAGVEDGKRIRLKGRGQPGGNGGEAGDLYIECAVRPHPYFRREGLDIYLDVPISITEASLGTKVDVPTLNGRVQMSIPPGTASGAKLRLRGRGVRDAADKSGDQYVVVRVVAPKTLTDEQKRLLEELHDTIRESPRKDLPWGDGAC